MPRIKTTRTVNIALFVLRIYLIGMLALILAKFVMEARKHSAPIPQGTRVTTTCSIGWHPAAGDPRA